MRALTIQQPFASLIASGVKRVENRTWRTHVRERIAIHAGSGKQWLRRWEGEMPASTPMGCIVAVAEIVACVHVSDLLSVPAELAWLRNHAHATGPYCWVLANVQELESPVPCTGSLGFWKVPDQVEVDVLTAINGVAA